MNLQLDRECGVCGSDSVVSRREAREVYHSGAVVNVALDRHADALGACASPECGAVFVPHP